MNKMKMITSIAALAALSAMSFTANAATYTADSACTSIVFTGFVCESDGIEAFGTAEVVGDTVTLTDFGFIASGDNGFTLTMNGDLTLGAAPTAIDSFVCESAPDGSCAFGPNSVNVNSVFATLTDGVLSVQQDWTLVFSPAYNLATASAGTVPEVPVPAAVWLMGSALGLLGFARRKTA